MRKLLLYLLFATSFSLTCDAQTPDSTKKESIKKISLIHGISAGVGDNLILYTERPGPTLGYFVDIFLRGRTWLCIGFNFEYYRVRYRGINNDFWGQPYTYKTNHSNLDFTIPIRFAFRTGKENSRFNFYPTAGLGLYLPFLYRSSYYKNNQLSSRYWGYDDLNGPLLPMVNIGFECRWKLSAQYNLSIGINSNYLLYNTFHLKFGWNKYKK